MFVLNSIKENLKVKDLACKMAKIARKNPRKDEISSKIDFLNEETRGTIINWPKLLSEIVDGYLEFRGVPHGVQKDSIQNGWDARKNKKGLGWSFKFELIENKNRNFLAMVDEGTHGLTGGILTSKELAKDLDIEERWGRFENLAFTKEKTERALGSRGRGKFIFVGASDIKTIVYDSLREDGTYRCGVRAIQKTESPVIAYDGEKGKKKLKEWTEDTFEPLNKVGTRIIILDPDQNMILRIRNDGSFLRNIGETWWEIISKYGVKITLKEKDKIYTAKAPKEFFLPEKDNTNFKVKILENKKISNDCKIKKLYIISNQKESVPEDLRGISIQRGGMKVCCIVPEGMPLEIANTIYGYVTLDEKTEMKMQEAENVEHYSFNFRKLVPSQLKHFILGELNNFAKEKLGWGANVNAIKQKNQREGEKIALNAINKFAKEAGFFAGGKGRLKKDVPSIDSKKIRVKLTPIKFPREKDLRVNYNESLENISMEIINDSNIDINLKVAFFLKRKDETIKNFFRGDLLVLRNSSSKKMGVFKQFFSKKDFPYTGKYSIYCQIVSLLEINKGEAKIQKGERIDSKSKIFYLEEDPPGKGLFEDCDGIEYTKEHIKLMGEAVPGSKKGYIFQYNIKHPTYLSIEDLNSEEIGIHLFRLMAHELCRIDLLREKSVFFNESDKMNPDLILSKTLRKIGEFMYKYHTS